MAGNLNIPWKRYGVIVDLARRMESKQSQFGKTALQKMIFILQDVFKIDCGYEFSLHTYGPFSSQIVHDLDFVETSKGVEVQSIGPSSGYIILPGLEADRLQEKAAEFLNNPEVQNALNRLVEEFGDYSAKDLELISTITYVTKDLSEHNDFPARGEVVQTVKQLKPKFSEDLIDKQIQDLLDNAFIQVS